jgi:hypothetical protein
LAAAPMKKKLNFAVVVVEASAKLDLRLTFVSLLQAVYKNNKHNTRKDTLPENYNDKISNHLSSSLVKQITSLK